MKPAPFFTTLAAAALAVLPATADTPPRAAVDALNQAQLQDIFTRLRAASVQREKLTLEELNRAALEGLLGRMDFTAQLISPASPPPLPLVAEKLGDTFACLRPGQFTAAELPAIDAALQQWTEEKVTTLILDLRAPAAPGDLAVAESLLSRFLPAGQLLFTLPAAGTTPARTFTTIGQSLWSGSVILLLDSETGNVAETVAALLLRTLKPASYGTPTRGQALAFDTLPLGPDTRLLFGTVPVTLPDGTSLLRQPSVPATRAPEDPAAKRTIFAAAEKQGLKPFLFETSRPRVNEAALINKDNPELPYKIARTAGQTTQWDTPPLIDRPLQQVVDVLLATEFLATPPVKK